MSIINKFGFCFLFFVIININGIKRTYYDCKKTISPHIGNWCCYKGCGRSEILITICLECFINFALTLIIKITKQQHLPSTEKYKIHILSTSSSSSSLSMLLFIFTSSSNDYLFNVIR